MNLKVETEQEDDGRWIADVPELPGVVAYGATRAQAVAYAEALPQAHRGGGQAAETVR